MNATHEDCITSALAALSAASRGIITLTVEEALALLSATDHLVGSGYGSIVDMAALVRARDALARMLD